MDAIALLSPGLNHSVASVVFSVLYVGPEVFMPILSAVAGALGVLLLFWQRVTGALARLVRAIFDRRS